MTTIGVHLLFKHEQTHFQLSFLYRPPLEEVWRWADSFEALLSNKCRFTHTHTPRYTHEQFIPCVMLKLFPGGSDGMAVFRHFLRSEFSEENLDFWLAVDKYKKTRTLNKMATRAHSIFNEFISTSASRQVLLSVHRFIFPRECPAFCPSLV